MFLLEIPRTAVNYVGNTRVRYQILGCITVRLMLRRQAHAPFFDVTYLSSRSFQLEHDLRISKAETRVKDAESFAICMRGTIFIRLNK